MKYSFSEPSGRRRRGSFPGADADLQSNFCDRRRSRMSQTIQEAFDQAVAHHRAGRLVEARTLYQQVLERQTDHAEALHLLGVTALQGGKKASAESADQAIQFVQ